MSNGETPPDRYQMLPPSLSPLFDDGSESSPVTLAELQSSPEASAATSIRERRNLIDVIDPMLQGRNVEQLLANATPSSGSSSRRGKKSKSPTTNATHRVEKKTKAKNGHAEKPFSAIWYNNTKKYALTTLYHKVTVPPMQKFLRDEGIDVEKLFPRRGSQFYHMEGDQRKPVIRGHAIAYAVMKVHQCIITHRSNGGTASEETAPNLPAAVLAQVISEIKHDNDAEAGEIADVNDYMIHNDAEAGAAADENDYVIHNDAGYGNNYMIHNDAGFVAVADADHPTFELFDGAHNDESLDYDIPDMTYTQNVYPGAFENSNKRRRSPEDSDLGQDLDRSQTFEDLMRNDGQRDESLTLMRPSKRPRLVGPEVAHVTGRVSEAGDRVQAGSPSGTDYSQDGVQPELEHASFDFRAPIRRHCPIVPRTQGHVPTVSSASTDMHVPSLIEVQDTRESPSARQLRNSLQKLKEWIQNSGKSNQALANESGDGYRTVTDHVPGGSRIFLLPQVQTIVRKMLGSIAHLEAEDNGVGASRHRNDMLYNQRAELVNQLWNVLHDMIPAARHDKVEEIVADIFPMA